MPIAQLAEVKPALRVDFDDDDSLLTTYISASDGAIRDWLGETFVDGVLTMAALAAPTSTVTQNQIDIAKRDKDKMFSAAVFYCRELYEGNSKELTPGLPTPHAFYRILKPLQAKSINEEYAAELESGKVEY